MRVRSARGAAIAAAPAARPAAGAARAAEQRRGTGMGLLQLSDGMLYEALARCDAHALAAAACACRRLRAAAADARLWRGVLRGALGDEADAVLPPDGRATRGDRLVRAGNWAAEYRARLFAWKYGRWVAHRTVRASDDRHSGGTSAAGGEKARPGAGRGDDGAHGASWTPRYLHRSCSAPNPRFVVLFGGQGESQTFFNDTCVLDTQAPGAGPMALPIALGSERPDARCSGTLTLVSSDAAGGHHAVVLFGGSQGATHGFRDDMWALDLPDWLVRPESAEGQALADLCGRGEPCRWQHVRPCPSVRHRAIVEGGWNATSVASADSAESQIDAPPPPSLWPAARWGHAACFLPETSHLVIFGGSSTSGCFSDVWAAKMSRKADRWRAEWDLVMPEAAELATDGRSMHSVYASMDGVEMMTRSLGCTPASPAPRAGHTMVRVEPGKLVVCGGNTGTSAFNDLWSLHLSPALSDCSSASDCGLSARWTLLETTGMPPSPRVGHTAVKVGSRMIVHGGRSMPSLVHGDYAALTGHFASGPHMLDLKKLRWSTPDLAREECGGAEKRTGHALAPCEGGLMVIGGLSEGGMFRNTVQRMTFFYDVKGF